MGEKEMPKIKVNDITMNYEQQGTGEARQPECGLPPSTRKRSNSGWPRTDPYLKVVVQGWQTMAKGLGSVTDMVIQGIFPWCFTPELYAAKPDYVESLAAFVRGRPVQPLDAFLRQSDAVIAHDAGSALGGIKAPTQITFGRHDAVTSTRFADAMKNGIGRSELTIFEGCAHAPIYENVGEFNEKTLSFLKRNTG
jgi:3-oxoadipate enol-lactonase